MLRAALAGARRAAIAAPRRSFAAAAGAAGGVDASRKAGATYVWGRIEDHRLGMKLTDDMFTLREVTRSPRLSTPTWNPNLANVVQVVTRASKTLALTADGSVWSWGTCANFSLGHGEDTTAVKLPRKVEALAGIKIVQIDAGETSSAAVSADGEVFTWGWGGSFWRGNGGLGHGNNVSQPLPALVEELADTGVKVAQVAVGNAHMLALTREGTVFSWGNGEFGRCGNGKRNQPTPEPVDLLQEHKCTQVAAGANHSFAVAGDGRVWGWGKNDATQLGTGGAMVMDLNTMEEYPLPVTLDENEGKEDARLFNGRVVRLAAGSTHTLAITADGSVWEWGGRTFLQPTRVPFASLKPAVAEQEAAAAGTAPALAAGGGSAGNGGVKPGKDGSVPLRAVAVAAGEGLSAALDASGNLFTWGQLRHAAGLGHPAGFLGAKQPQRVDALAGIPVGCVSLGSQHAAACVGVPPSL